MKRPYLFTTITVLILLFTYSSVFAETVTGCLKPDGKIFRFKVGTAPKKKKCKKKWVQVNLNQGPLGEQGPQGLQGPQGPQGKQGKQGRRARVKGPVYTGVPPINVTGLTIGLNPGTAARDLLTYDGANWVAAKPSLALDDKMQPWLGVNYIIATTGVYPSRSGVDPLIATVEMFGGNFAPRGWAFCDGQLLPIAQNTALFSLLGTIYGGDGRSTFGLPDLRGRVPVGDGRGPGLTDRRLGRIGGTETHQ